MKEIYLKQKAFRLFADMNLAVLSQLIQFKTLMQIKAGKHFDM